MVKKDKPQQNYEIHEVKLGEVVYFCVWETTTEQVVNYYTVKADAVDRKRFLLSGGAFDGITPRFMIVYAKVDTIDKRFSEAFG